MNPLYFSLLTTAKVPVYFIELGFLSILSHHDVTSVIIDHFHGDFDIFRRLFASPIEISVSHGHKQIVSNFSYNKNSRAPVIDFN